MRMSDWSSDVCSSDLVGHDDQFAGAFDQLLHNAHLIGVGIGKYGVKRDDQRRADAIDEFEYHVSSQSAEQAELVLQPNHVGAAHLDPPRGIDNAIRVAYGTRRAEGR